MRRFFALLLASALLGCSSTPTKREAESELSVCKKIGWIFYAIAAYEEAGSTRNEQVLWANRSIDSGEARQAALRIIHAVYVSETEPVELGVRTRRQCKLNSDGVAVVELHE